MLRVKTKVQPSSVHGMGLFADQFIPKGTLTWNYDPECDPSYSKKELNSMPKLTREFFLYYCFFEKKLKKFIMCNDNQRYINHSNDPKKINIKSISQLQDITLRDIQPGEELFCDYTLFDSTYFKRMGIDKKKLK
jgi:SET domain-containing protein